MVGAGSWSPGSAGQGATDGELGCRGRCKAGGWVTIKDRDRDLKTVLREVFVKLRERVRWTRRRAREQR